MIYTVNALHRAITVKSRLGPELKLRHGVEGRHWRSSKTKHREKTAGGGQRPALAPTSAQEPATDQNLSYN